MSFCYFVQIHKVKTIHQSSSSPYTTCKFPRKQVIPRLILAMNKNFVITVPLCSRRKLKCSLLICTQEGVSTSLVSSLHLFSRRSFRVHGVISVYQSCQPNKSCFHFSRPNNSAGKPEINLQTSEKKNRFRWGKQGASPSLSPSGMALMHYYPDEQVWLTAQCWGIKTGKCALRAFAVRITETQRFWGAYLRCRLMSACEPPTHILLHVMELFLLPSSWYEVLSKNLKKICIIWKL